MGSGFTVARGVVQDENGVWIFGILDGLNLIERRGHDNVIIQSDSLEAVRAIQDSVSIILNYVLIRRIQRLLSHE
ncbi:hypothetical protein Golob_016052, partial [Gossypium lobatum]|nr:hypothetical protein [Gossypium lobatum]